MTAVFPDTNVWIDHPDIDLINRTNEAEPMSGGRFRRSVRHQYETARTISFVGAGCHVQLLGALQARRVSSQVHEGL
ncbi:MAG: hypothetical protein MK538_13545, partial [Planctomycetes bacterium]|nr:hypothetical protein [Planctomycetota bacterium]